jgi:hypothetical protein
MSERPNHPEDEPIQASEAEEAEVAETDEEAIEAEASEADETFAEEGADVEESGAGSHGVSPGGAAGAGASERRPMRPSERRALHAEMERSKLTIEAAHRVTDRASAIFVALTVAVFTLIVLNALVLGHGGLLRPIPTPAPIPTAAPSGAPAASGSPAASTPAAATPAASGSTAPVPTPVAPATTEPGTQAPSTPAPTAAPTAAPSAS